MHMCKGGMPRKGIVCRFHIHDYQVKEYRTNNGAMGVTCIGTNLSTIAKLTYSNVGAWHFKVCGPYVVILLKLALVYEWYMARLVVKHKHQIRHVSRWDWTLCSKYRHHSKFDRWTQPTWKTYMNVSNRRGIFTLTSYNFYTSTLNLKLDMTIFVICKLQTI